jgi:hypothetical protein
MAGVGSIGGGREREWKEELGEGRDVEVIGKW